MFYRGLDMIKYIFLLFILCCSGCRHAQTEDTVIKVSVLRGPSVIAFADWLENPPIIDNKKVQVKVVDSPDLAQALLIKQETDIAVLPMIPKEPCKMIVIDLHDRAKMDAYRAAMEPWAKGKISMFYSSPHYLEHVPEHVSKGHAVKKLCELLQIPLANTVAAGDQENDISMIEAAAVGAAMKNATDAVKASADYITENDCNHSGVAEILRKFILA